MRLMVGASVAVKWLIAEDGSGAAHRLAASSADLHAPRLMASEIANALWRKARLSEIERLGQRFNGRYIRDSRSLVRRRDGLR